MITNPLALPHPHDSQNNLGLISQEKYEDYSQSVIRQAVQHGYGTSLYKPGNTDEVIGDYGTIARDLFDREMISESHYLSLLLDLGMDAEELEYLVFPLTV